MCARYVPVFFVDHTGKGKLLVRGREGIVRTPRLRAARRHPKADGRWYALNVRRTH